MEVKFADTFGESLQRLASRERWYWKLFDLFRYDLPRFFGNVWRFRKALWNHYWWDHHGTLRFMEIGLDHMATNLEEKGLEIDISRLKKVAAMKRAAELIRNYNEDLYIDMAEAELGEIKFHPFEFKPTEDKEGFFELVEKDTPEEAEHKRKVFARAREIEAAEWKELWRLIQGQDHEEYEVLFNKLTEEEKSDRDHYYTWFDGSNMKGWWD